MSLVDFLTQLAVNPIQQEQFAADPKAVLAGSGLSPQDQAALLCGDRESLSAVAAQSLPAAHQAAVAGNCFVADPGPDPDSDHDPWPDIAVSERAVA